MKRLIIILTLAIIFSSCSSSKVYTDEPRHTLRMKQERTAFKGYIKKVLVISFFSMAVAVAVKNPNILQ